MKPPKVARFQVRMIQNTGIETAQLNSERVYRFMEKTNQAQSDRPVPISVSVILTLLEVLAWLRVMDITIM